MSEIDDSIRYGVQIENPKDKHQNPKDDEQEPLSEVLRIGFLCSRVSMKLFFRNILCLLSLLPGITAITVTAIIPANKLRDLKGQKRTR